MTLAGRPLLWLGTVAAMLVAVTGIWALRTFDPNVAGNPFPPCMFHLLTGYFCAGCGITRALHALVHGDLMAALRFNVLAVGLLALSPLAMAWHIGWRPRSLGPVAHFLGHPAPWLILLSAYWILRNLPWAPFSWLAPG